MSDPAAPSTAVVRTFEPLTEAESLAFTDCEDLIRSHEQSFVLVIAALDRIRERRLYRATHDSFEEYIETRWGWGRKRAQQMIRAHGVVAEIAAKSGMDVDTAVSEGVAPPTERHIRELTAVPDGERSEVWEDAKREAETEGRDPTSQDVRKARAKVIPIVHRKPTPPKSPEPTPEPETSQHEPDPIAEWERAEKEVQRLQSVVDALDSDDPHSEIARLSQRIAGLEGRLQQSLTTQGEAQRTAKYAQGVLRKIRDELGVERDAEILEAIRDLKR